MVYLLFCCALLLSWAKFVVKKSTSSFLRLFCALCQSARHWWRYFSATLDPLKRPLTFCDKGLEGYEIYCTSFAWPASTCGNTLLSCLKALPWMSSAAASSARLPFLKRCLDQDLSPTAPHSLQELKFLGTDDWHIFFGVCWWLRDDIFSKTRRVFTASRVSSDVYF